MSDQILVPRILEFNDGELNITVEAMSIPEVKAIIDKYGDSEAKPYLAYVYLLSSFNSPHINSETEQAKDDAAADVHSTIGPFNPEEPLIDPAIKRLKEFYNSPIMRLYEELRQEIHRQRVWLRDTPITDGKEGNIAIRQRFIEKIGTVIGSYKAAEKMAEEELKTKMRGKSVLGDY
jgi:hypothetical protein